MKIIKRFQLAGQNLGLKEKYSSVVNVKEFQPSEKLHSNIYGVSLKEESEYFYQLEGRLQWI